MIALKEPYQKLWSIVLEFNEKYDEWMNGEMKKSTNL
jgi:hypothetical protein